MFGLRAAKVFHPESPGVKLVVVRGFWGRLFKPRDFATLGEALEYHARCLAELER